MIGATISHYRITRQIGSGGMGLVYEAQDTRLDRTVALKFLTPRTIPDSEAKARFIQEAKAASGLDHPNVCVIHDIDEAPDGRLFMAMAHYSGETLKERITRGPVPLDEALPVIRQVAAGLAAAHARGIVHRDLKPSNIFLTTDGMVKILDFGLAKLTGQSDITRAGAPVGSTLYMAPEQVSGAETHVRTDVWGLGTLLYEMLTGEAPFHGGHEYAVLYAILHEDPPDLAGKAPDLPDGVASCVMDCLAKNPTSRPAGMAEIVARLGGDKAAVTEDHQPGPAEPPRGRRLGPMVVLAAMAVAAMVLALVPILRRGGAEPKADSWIVLADPVNQTEDEGLAPLLTEALAIGLQQSQHVKLFTGQRRDLALERMGRLPAEDLPVGVARELAQREGLDAVLATSLEKVEMGLQVIVKLLEPGTGESFHTGIAIVQDAQEMVAALDGEAREIRERLGESEGAISRSSEPLARVTTPSLEALRFYSLGVRESDRDGAITLLRQAVAADSSFAMAHARLARELMYSAATEGALHHSGRAFALRERLPVRERLYVEGEYYRLRSQFRPAIESMTALLELHPEDTDCRTNLVHAYMFLIQYGRALEQFDQLDEEIKSGLRGHHTRGLLLAGLERFDESVASFGRAIGLARGPGLASRLCQTQAYVCDGNLEPALAQLDTILALDTQAVIGADYMAGRTLPALGRFDESANHLRAARNTALAVGDTNRAAWAGVYLGMGGLARGDAAGAAAALREAAAFWPGDVPYYWWGVAAEAAGNTAEADRAEAALARLAEDDPTNRNQRSLAKLRGARAFGRGDFATAIELLKECPLDLDARLLLGRCHAAAGDLSAARAEFRYVVKNRFHAFVEGLVTTWPLAYYYLGVAAQLAGDQDEAQANLSFFATLWRGADPGVPELEDAKLRLGQLGVME